MTDPRADALRRGYAPVATAYREALLDELTHKPLDRAFLDAFAERTRAGRVLEIGCGPGHVAGYLASRGATVEGTDLSPAMIDEARASFPALDFAVADMFALPHAASTFAGVVGFYAIVHLESDALRAPFAECHRVLAPGGLLALAFHCTAQPRDERVHVDSLFECDTSLDFFFHHPERVIAALTDAGFTLEARLDRAPYPEVEHPTQRCYVLARK